MPLSDGSELAADVFLPEGRGPYPTLVILTPYRKDDLIGVSYEYPIRFFLERNYAHVLADLRGLGSSSGVSAEAMSQSEAADGAALVEWAAAQPWSDGNIGMWGVSYGGITAFQTASARPPHLRAIIPIYGTFDVYGHWFYPGGCFNCLGMSTWVSQMLALQLAPPMYHDPGGRWYDIWERRLEQSEPYILPWMEHRTRDAFWQEKEIPIERIEAATFLIGGWRDLYPEAMTRAYERITAPRKLWMGPWPHVVPDSSPIGAVEHLPEMCRWFDTYLRRESNGIEEEPPVTLFTQGAAAGWRYDAEWPIAGTEERLFFIRPGGTLVNEPQVEDVSVRYVSRPAVGAQAGLWDPRGTGVGLPLDQRPDDEHSLSFTTDPLETALEVTGSGEALLTFAVDDGEDLNLVVKLCDVAPDGRSELVTTGWLKASHRLSHERTEPLPPGEPVKVRVPLWATSYRIATGHRLRVSISCADFPRIWPTRTNPRVAFLANGDSVCCIRLPVAPPSGIRGRAPLAADPYLDRARLRHESIPTWQLEQDFVAGATTVVFGDRRVMTTPGCDGRIVFDLRVQARVADHSPSGAATDATTRYELDTPSGAHVLVLAKSEITLDGFVLEGRVEVDGRPFFEKSWTG